MIINKKIYIKVVKRDYVSLFFCLMMLTYTCIISISSIFIPSWGMGFWTAIGLVGFVVWLVLYKINTKEYLKEVDEIDS